MNTLTPREKRTIRLATVAISLYLVLFFGLKGWKHLETKRAQYSELLTDALRVKRELLPYENKILLAQKLKESFQLDPKKLARASVVGEASDAIQKAAKTGGVQFGPIRESAARPSARELASMQLEGIGPVPAVMTLLHRLPTLGYPLILDQVQISPEASKPGMIKVSLTIVILDFDQWKNEEAPRA